MPTNTYEHLQDAAASLLAEIDEYDGICQTDTEGVFGPDTAVGQLRAVLDATLSTGSNPDRYCDLHRVAWQELWDGVYGCESCFVEDFHAGDEGAERHNHESED